jgi:hypothetical protein
LKKQYWIISLWVAIFASVATASFSQGLKATRIDFFGDTIEMPLNSVSFVNFTDSLSQESIQAFYEKMKAGHYEPVIQMLLDYKKQHETDDWLFYQLIRKTAQLISPKSENYPRYTLYKWFFLTETGYDATIAISCHQLLFYVYSPENIYNIPYRMKNGKQYVCLNYHDYGSIDFTKTWFKEVEIAVPGATNSFSYKITKLPRFEPGDYQEKDLQFVYNENEYHFKVKLNSQVKTIFANYPVVDYASYFNIPLSLGTYSSLIPALKKNIKGMSVKDGIDYLMHFTRYAFLFKTDQEAFGQEKRLSPEQTLLYDNSDCEDRAGLLFYLVKEIYNLPMIVVEYPKHVTIAIKLDKPYGNTIVYNGVQYTVCEPSPQKDDLRVGQILPSLRHSSFDIPYAYMPENK